jgi:hypothetical protein
MKYEDFLSVGLQLQKQDRILDELYKNKVDLIDLVDPYHDIIHKLITEVYGTEGAEWFSWFCYESEYGARDWSLVDSYKTNEDGTSTLVHKAGEARYGATDQDGNPICYDWESLYNYLEQLLHEKK